MRHLASPHRAAPATSRLALRITGAVQGVGFRPYVYRLAQAQGLAGWVRNTPGGVSLEIEGEERTVRRFVSLLQVEVRPPAAIDTVDCMSIEPLGEALFRCEVSAVGDSFTGHILPDLVICDECRAEICDPENRRHGYPFTSCMHCGPRFSIIEALPYDRARTVMRHFPMCPACEAEYRDPASRRFHAETNACPDCGPQLTLLDRSGTEIATGGEAMGRAADGIARGKIIALKGLGGFQLVVDARDVEAVARLRDRKRRPGKPFAVMVQSVADASDIVHLSAAERTCIGSRAGPIVLLRRRGKPRPQLAEGVAPHSPLVGLMLPTTPLHNLLLLDLGFPIIATSGNLNGEPIAATDAEALASLSDIADLFLTHDRPILHRVDDSVVRMIDGESSVLRCARGFAPIALEDSRQGEPVLALGGHLKSSLALGANGRIVLGPHIGDLDGAETRKHYATSASELARLHTLSPAQFACDAHPGYHSTALAETTHLPVVKVQHHLAHILSAMVEHGLEGPVLGIAWDGSGFGEDGTIWGGEFLQVRDVRWHRVAHMREFPLSGGDSAIREPRRSAIGALSHCFGEDLWADSRIPSIAAFSSSERKVLRAALERAINTPLTSSVGRLFDAVASILGLCQISSFEGEAAMAVEFAAGRARDPVALPPPVLSSGAESDLIDWRAMVAALCQRKVQGGRIDSLAAGFHHWLADAALLVARKTAIGQVVLTGGCFQNALLSKLVAERLRQAGFVVFLHRKVPCNDGGLAVGQAAFAARSLARKYS